MQRTMEQESTDVDSKESTLAAEAVKLELLHQLEEYTNHQAQQESTESPNTSSRTKRSVIDAPHRVNKDENPRYRRDAQGVLRRVYNWIFAVEEEFNF